MRRTTQPLNLIDARLPPHADSDASLEGMTELIDSPENGAALNPTPAKAGKARPASDSPITSAWLAQLLRHPGLHPQHPLSRVQQEHRKQRP